MSLPFVARETMPVLRELGTDAEQAAATLGANSWQTFWRITLPGIRWGVVYGVVLTTARALGEFGAVSIVSGRIEGQTQTLPLYVQDRFENFDTTGAYTAAVVLALLALATLLCMNLLTARRRERGAPPDGWRSRADDVDASGSATSPRSDDVRLTRRRRRAHRAARAERQRQVDAAARSSPGWRRPTAARCVIGGEDATATPARERGVGFVFQHYAPFKHMTVRDNVAFGLTRAQAPQGGDRARA